MILKPLPHIQAVVLDLDGTTYPFNAEYHKACLAALARTTRFAVSDRFNGKLDEARDHVAKHGLHGHTPNHLLRLTSHAREAMTTDFIRPAPALALHMQQMAKPLYVLSNSSPLWIDAVLQKRGLDKVIPAHHRFSARSDFGQSKRHMATYERLAEKLRIKDRSRILLADDEANNLLAASSVGFSTAAIGQFNAPNLHYVNIISPDVKALLGHLFPLPPAAPAARP